MEKTLGQIGYEAYAQSTGGKTFDGREMPTWQEIKDREGETPKVTKAWEAAAHAIIEGALQKQPFRPQGLGHHLFASSHHLLAAASEPEVMPPKDHG